MRIVDTNSTPNTNGIQTGRTGATRPANGVGTGGTGSSKVSSGGDSVELSGFSGKVSQTLQTDASARAQKVSQIAAAVQNGTYKVDSKAVSQAIIQHSISGVDRDGDGDGR